MNAGSGVPDISQAWKDAGLDAPVVEEKFGCGTPDRIILTLLSYGENTPKAAYYLLFGGFKGGVEQARILRKLQVA